MYRTSSAVSDGSVTKILVSRNGLGDVGATTLCDALRESTVTKVQELDLSHNDIGPEGAKAVAAMAAVVGSITECDLRQNKLGVEGWTIIFNSLRVNPSSKITTWDLSSEYLGPEIAKPLAKYLSATGSMTALDMRFNSSMDDKGRALVKDAVKGRVGFDLKL